MRLLYSLGPYAACVATANVLSGSDTLYSDGAERATKTRLQVTGYRSQVAGRRSQVAGRRSQVAKCKNCTRKSPCLPFTPSPLHPFTPSPCHLVTPSPVPCPLL